VEPDRGILLAASLNIYDEARGAWHQTWVDETGTLLLLEGGMRAGWMELEGRDVSGNLQRIRWRPDPDRGVFQQWEQSSDGGKTWQTRFEGSYRRKG